jgi:hypothetical protein
MMMMMIIIIIIIGSRLTGPFVIESRTVAAYHQNFVYNHSATSRFSAPCSEFASNTMVHHPISASK